MHEPNHFYIVYETTNLINGKYYVGVHKQYDIAFDNYLGSGFLLNKSINKHGKENFIRETLFQYGTSDEAFLKEAEIVNDMFVENTNTYNIMIGGFGSGGFSKESRKKMSRSHSGKILSQAHKERISEYAKNNPYKHSPEIRKKMSKGRTGIVFSEDHKRNIGLAQKGKTKSPRSKEHSKNNINSRLQNGKEWHSELTRNKISETIKNKPRVCCIFCERVIPIGNLNQHQNGKPCQEKRRRIDDRNRRI